MNISYSKKLPASTADDVEGKLYDFIPAGQKDRLPLFSWCDITSTDFLKNETTFKERVELDATSFRPLGEKVHSYSREDVEFEVYHVRLLLWTERIL